MLCKNINGNNSLRRPDAFVRCYLMPGTHMELRTKIVKNNNRHPFYNDEFQFAVCIKNVYSKFPLLIIKLISDDFYSREEEDHRVPGV